MRIDRSKLCSYGAAAALLAGAATAASAAASPSYRVFVTNERSGDLTVINGTDFSVMATIPVGKRPRGIHVSPDGKTVYVAVSGTPIEAPPQIDANGIPVFEKKKGGGDDDDDANADKSADGIALVDVAAGKVAGKLQAGSDPEEFDLSRDGKSIYISNEDVRTASILDISSAKVTHIIPVGQEPEGVTTTPDGRQFYVTCEAGGDIFVVDTSTYKVAGHFKVNGRPRSVAFLSHGDVAFIPSESAGEFNVIDPVKLEVLETLKLPTGSRPMRARVSADDKKLYLSNGRSGTISVIDTHSDELLTTIKVGTRPWGIGFSPDGKYLFSANGPSNDVSVVDLATEKEIARVKAGSSPWGIAIVAAH
jgi:YVTN family beta-propeller protein